MSGSEACSALSTDLPHGRGEGAKVPQVTVEDEVAALQGKMRVSHVCGGERVVERDVWVHRLHPPPLPDLSKAEEDEEEHDDEEARVERRRRQRLHQLAHPGDLRSSVRE